MKIRELLSDETKWTKDAYARDAAGALVRCDRADAACHCLVGAMILCYAHGPERDQVRAKVANVIGQDKSVVAWNDAPERTFAEVKALVDQLDI